MSTTLSLKDTENKYDVYSGKDYSKNLEDNWFYKKNWIYHRTNNRNPKKMENSALFVDKCTRDKKYHKVRKHCHYTD